MNIVDLVVAPERRARPGTPATHVLVIGISAYRHLIGGTAEPPTGSEWAMQQLTAAAGSATAIAAWFATRYQNPNAPVGSLRVLISAGPDDQLDPLIAPHVATPECRATRINVQTELGAFVTDCATSTQNVAIVYVVGHGVQLTKHQATVLLEDIGAPGQQSLWGAIDMTQCHEAMDHGATAATQFWFVDACRQLPDISARFERMRGAFELDEMPGTAESSQCFLASASREIAFSRPGGRSLFCEALLECLEGAAVIGPDAQCPAWHLSGHSLSGRLRPRVQQLAQEEGETQTVHHFSKGLSPNAVLYRLDKPPKVALKIELDPIAAAEVSIPSLRYATSDPVPGVPAGWPLIMQLEAGLYTLEVATQDPYRPRPARILSLVPPTFADTAVVK